MSADQQIINYGASANDGTGDPLRTAFIKTDENFDAIWAAGPVGSNIVINNNTISSQNNNNLGLSANGIGVIQTNSTLVPTYSNLNNIGSANLRYRSAYIGVGGANIVGNINTSSGMFANAVYTNNYFYANGAPFTGGSSYGNANVAVYLPTYTGNLASLTGNVTTTANIAGNFFIGNGSQLTGLPEGYTNANVAAYLPTYTGNLVSLTGNVTTTGNITANYFVGNGSQLTGLPESYTNANVAAYLAGSAGNIIPVGNNTQSLGSATNRWANLWLSGNTIQLGDLSLSAGASGLTSTAGFDLANSSAANIEATGNITADYFVGDGSLLTNLPFDASQIENGTSNVAIATANGNVTITADSAQTWAFGTSGNLQFPDGTTYTGSEIDSPTVPTIGSTASAGEAGITYLSGDLSKWAIFSESAFTVGEWTDVQVGWTVTDNNGFTDTIAGRGSFGTASFQTTVNSWPAPASGKTYVFTSPDYQPGYTNPVEITVGSNTWSFGNTGALTTPGNINTTGNITADNFFGNTQGLTGNITNLVSLNFDVENISARGNAGVNIGAGGFNNLVVLETDVLVQNVPLSVTGNVTANLFIGNGSQLTNLPITYTNLIENGNSNVAISTADGNVTVTANTATWSFETGDSALGEFDESPVLRTPAGAGSVIYNETLMAILAGNIDAGERSSVRLLEGGVSLLGTTSLDGELSTIIMEVNTGGVGIRALGDAAPRLCVTGNVTGGNILTAGSVTANGNVTGGNISTAGAVSATGNLTANNISTGNVTTTRVQNGGNLEIRSNVAGTVKVWTFDAIGDLNLPFGGNIVGTGGILANTGTFTGNVTAANFEGNITITGNVTGTSANVDLVAGEYEWAFDNTGNLTLPGNTFSVNYANNTPVDVVTRFEDVWTVPTGNSTQSFTVDGNNSYQMWVEGNIPNGIIAWNATVTVTNTNVPVIGQQFAWNYEGGGNILMFNSIPAQIIGTAGAISNAEPAVGNTTNVFSFGINNASGNVANVRYGWIKIS